MTDINSKEVKDSLWDQWKYCRIKIPTFHSSTREGQVLILRSERAGYAFGNGEEGQVAVVKGQDDSGRYLVHLSDGRWRTVGDPHPLLLLG